MATGEFYCFNENGAYQIASAASQLAVSQVNMSNAYGGLLSGLATSTSSGGITQGFFTYPMSQGIAEASKDSTDSWRKKFDKKYPPVSRFTGILQKLAYEIDGWHGDVLQRCPA